MNIPKKLVVFLGLVVLCAFIIMFLYHNTAKIQKASNQEVDERVAAIEVNNEKLLKKIQALVDAVALTPAPQAVAPIVPQAPEPLTTTEDLRYNYVKKYPDVMDCRITYEEAAQHENEIQNHDVKNFNKNFHSKRIVRGYLVYFPNSQFDHFKPEFKWLYRSWIEMQKYEPNMWRTDMIVFFDGKKPDSDEKLKFFRELKCSFDNLRKSKSDPPMCVLLQYKALGERTYNPVRFNFQSKDALYEHFYDKFDIFNGDPNEFYTKVSDMTNYGYLDSILMAYDGYDYYKDQYDFLLRSDMDVFLTPLFGTWLPYKCNDFIAGGGGFSDQFNVNRLGRVAHNLNLKYANIWNLGSTWYSTPKQFRLMSYLTLLSMSYLYNEEFSPPERDSKLGVLLWPDWHYGVLLLYGQSVAMNHLIATKQLNILKKEGFVDYGTGDKKSIFEILHMHVFHGDDLFSKFNFKDGKYDKEDISKVDITKGKYYALYIALESKRMENKNLSELLDEQVKTKV